MVQLDKHCIFSVTTTLHLFQNPAASLVVLEDLKALSFIFYKCELTGTFILTGCE